MKIAIVEDDVSFRKGLEKTLKMYDEFSVFSFTKPTIALQKIDETYDMVISDLDMPKLNGVNFLRQLDDKLNGNFDAIVITGNPSMKSAIDAVNMGFVKNYIQKPFDHAHLIKMIKVQRTINLVQKQITTFTPKKEFIIKSENMKALLHKLKKAAPTDIEIFLFGESGVGKEEFAKFIHNNSPRALRKFQPINMAAIPANLIESELFGYEKGAFTDAATEKKGLLEMAHGGTIFLDEIGEMDYNLQAKLLRVLQEREIYRLGATIPIKIDVRIISATNAKLKEKIEQKEFREDLFHRLSSFLVNIPPLRERKEEIIPLAENFLKMAVTRFNLPLKPLSSQACKELHDFWWPGNIRELQKTIEGAIIVSENKCIEAQDLNLDLKRSYF